jgi:tetratricopeptide (TPR) repeat protein
MTHSAYTEANRKYQEHDYGVAETLLLKCLDAKFRESDCLNNLANTYCQSYLLSIHQYSTVETSTHQEIGEYKKAFKFYERAIELNPNHINANFNLGRHLLLRPNHEDKKKAMKYLKVAVLLCPKDSIALYHLARCKEAMMDDDGAIEDYTLAIQLDPSKPETLLARGSLYEVLGRREEARIDLDTAISLFPDMDAPYLERGKMKLDDGNLAGALIDFSKGLAINPESWPLYSHRSYVFSELAKNCSIPDSENVIENDFQQLAEEDKRHEKFHFEEEMSFDVLPDDPFMPDTRLRQCG